MDVVSVGAEVRAGGGVGVGGEVRVGGGVGTGGEGKAAGDGEDQESAKRKEDDAESARKGIHLVYMWV